MESEATTPGGDNAATDGGDSYLVMVGVIVLLIMVAFLVMALVSGQNVSNVFSNVSFSLAG